VAQARSSSLLQVSEYRIFYEIVDGGLFRRMEPLAVAYERHGAAATTVVCLHSVSGASRTFAPLIGRLTERLAVVTTDLRGFGDSHRPTLEYDVETLADDVEKVIAACELEAKPLVLGHGLGACVGLALARRGGVAALALSGVALGPGEPRALGAVIPPGERGEDVAATLSELTGVEAAAGDLTPQIIARVARAWMEFDGRPLLDELDVPLLVVGGDDDRLTPLDAEGGGAWVAERGGGRLVRLSGAHEVPVLHPVELGDAVLGWIDDWKE
jgi:pimeloyl-ACP methyl ester carboxylesterase